MSRLYYRHRLPVRIMHWINVIAFVALLMSGLMIFNAHPTLYWGDQSYGGAPKLLQIRAVKTDDGLRGLTTVLGHTFVTTGVLGVAPNGRGGIALHAFPYWATIPSYYSLAKARRWHLFFMWVLIANGIAYITWSLASRHLSRDLAPTSAASDQYVFKVPSLRNIALTPPYFHSGKAWDLRQAVAVMGASQLGISLKEAEVVQITACLDALTGDQPRVVLPVLPPSVATTPRPHP